MRNDGGIISGREGRSYNSPEIFRVVLNNSKPIITYKDIITLCYSNNIVRNYIVIILVLEIIDL